MKLTPPDTRQLADDAAEQIKRTEQRRFHELEARLAALEQRVSDKGDVGPWECIERIELSEARSTIEVRNLQGDADGEYLLRGYIRNSSGAGSWRFYPNGDTSSSYRTQRLTGDTSTASAGTSSSAGFRFAVSNSGDTVLYFEGCFYARTGHTRLYLGSVISVDASPADTRLGIHGGFWDDNTTQVTSIEFGGLTYDAGTRIEIYRRAPWPS